MYRLFLDCRMALPLALDILYLIDTPLTTVAIHNLIILHIFGHIDIFNIFTFSHFHDDELDPNLRKGLPLQKSFSRFVAQ